MPESEPTSPSDSPPADELRKAMKAFKKRLKLTRLDDDSTLGRGAMTGGKSSGIVAIAPPNQYPQAIWDKLVELGRLENEGHGLYQIPKP